MIFLSQPKCLPSWRPVWLSPCYSSVNVQSLLSLPLINFCLVFSANVGTIPVLTDIWQRVFINIFFSFGKYFFNFLEYFQSVRFLMMINDTLSWDSFICKGFVVSKFTRINFISLIYWQTKYTIQCKNEGQESTGIMTKTHTRGACWHVTPSWEHFDVNKTHSDFYLT